MAKIIAKHTYGYKKDKKDKRDLIHPGKKLFSPIPKSADLRMLMTPVFAQGELGSCTANALVGMREYLAKEKTTPVSLSRLFVYYKEREMEGNINEDAGAEIRDGMKVLNKIGACPEIDDPYDITKFTEKPSAQAVKDAKTWTISVYRRIVSLTAAKVALAAGDPVVFGFPVYESFESDAVSETGLMVMPKAGEDILGGHAVLAVGYDDKKKWLIVRNSWGKDWGDKGYFYMPYKFFTKYFSDAWIATK